MKFKKNSLLIKSVMLSFLLLLSNVGYSAAWTDYLPVEVVYPYNNGTILVSHNPRISHINPDGCNSSSWYALEADNIGNGNIYKLLLTAIASGKRVRFYLSGCRSGNAYPVILHANIRSN